MSPCDDAFDLDRPYFVTPCAVRLARAPGIPDAGVPAIATADRWPWELTQVI